MGVLWWKNYSFIDGSFLWLHSQCSNCSSEIAILLYSYILIVPPYFYRFSFLASCLPIYPLCIFTVAPLICLKYPYFLVQVYSDCLTYFDSPTNMQNSSADVTSIVIRSSGLARVEIVGS